MATKKSAPAKSEEPTPADLPEESIDEENHPVEPLVENPPVEANPDGPVESGVEQPPGNDVLRGDVTEPDDESDAPQPAPEINEPTPWRVETYSDGFQWGWRLCAANGNIIRESGTFFDSPDAAISDAQENGDTGTAQFPSGPSRAW